VHRLDHGGLRWRRRTPWATFVLTAGLALGALLLAFRIPYVQDRLGWRVAELRANIRYALRPPEQSVFTPDPLLVSMVEATLRAYTPSPMPSPTAGPSATPMPTATVTPVPTPIAERVELTGVRHEYQGWNNCGPANLAMALSYWGWTGDQRPIAAFTKPNREDKNVMPYELAAYIEQETDFEVIVRVGGDLDLLRRLLAAGYPVIVEKGLDVADKGWMGHYQLVTGYDDARQRFTAQDSFEGGPNLPMPYEKMATLWRHFNYVYLVIFPPERRAEVLALLGPHADETYAIQVAAQRASAEIFTTTGGENFFAWINRGSSLVALQDYAGGAAAYDEAFRVYARLDPADRPWRTMWYITGPYWAYYYTGRYYDVLNLATQTLANAGTPALEESFYWRALAKEALGDATGAVADLRTSLEWHPGFAPSLAALQRLGAAP
jgi:tetratricopeptide (TPR) repeat protein